MDTDWSALMPFASHIGLTVTEATPQRVTGTMTVTPQLCTTGDAVHGGALMAMADSLGALAAFLNLPDGASGTTTIESKTNFLGAAAVGSEVTAVTTEVKAGRRISVWRTTMTTGDKLVAEVTQSQLVL